MTTTTMKKTAGPAASPLVRVYGVQAARQLGIAPQTLYNRRSLIEQGKLPVSALPPLHRDTWGGRPYYLQHELDEYIRAGLEVD